MSVVFTKTVYGKAVSAARTRWPESRLSFNASFIRETTEYLPTLLYTRVTTIFHYEQGARKSLRNERRKREICASVSRRYYALHLSNGRDSRDLILCVQYSYHNATDARRPRFTNGMNG